MAEKTELLEEDEKVVEIELERLRGFENHPFKVRADSQMIELQESIKKYGILNPLIVRPKKDGCYEIISGHRRKFAAEKIGYRRVPVIIRVLKDDEAVVLMVDSNLQREMISPSEKAFAYKMKYEAIKRKAGRRKCGQVDHNLGTKSIELIGEECGGQSKTGSASQIFPSHLYSRANEAGNIGNVEIKYEKILGCVKEKRIMCKVIAVSSSGFSPIISLP